MFQPSGPRSARSVRFREIVNLGRSHGVGVRERVVQRGIDQWRIREMDATAVPGSRGTTCLVCESFDVIRRLWIFPEDWASMCDDALWRLCEEPPLPR